MTNLPRPPADAGRICELISFFVNLPTPIASQVCLLSTFHARLVPASSTSSTSFVYIPIRHRSGKFPFGIGQSPGTSLVPPATVNTGPQLGYGTYIGGVHIRWLRSFSDHAFTAAPLPAPVLTPSPSPSTSCRYAIAVTITIILALSCLCHIPVLAPLRDHPNPPLSLVTMMRRWRLRALTLTLTYLVMRSHPRPPR